MILSDNDIRARLQNNDLGIEPMKVIINADNKYEVTEHLELDPTQIQPASVDLTLGANFLRPGVLLTGASTLGDGHRTYVKNTSIDEEGREIIHLNEGECILGHTREYLRIPLDISASVSGKSSVGRRFVEVHQTAGYIDPGFEGQVTLEIVNNNPYPVRLVVGMRIAQLVLCETKSPSDGYQGNYQKQVGPRESKL